MGTAIGIYDIRAVKKVRSYPHLTPEKTLRLHQD